MMGAGWNWLLCKKGRHGCRKMGVHSGCQNVRSGLGIIGADQEQPDFVLSHGFDSDDHKMRGGRAPTDWLCKNGRRLAECNTTHIGDHRSRSEALWLQRFPWNSPLASLSMQQLFLNAYLAKDGWSRRQLWLRRTITLLLSSY